MRLASAGSGHPWPEEDGMRVGKPVVPILLRHRSGVCDRRRKKLCHMEAGERHVA